jgi:hypothetical protein
MSVMKSSPSFPFFDPELKPFRNRLGTRVQFTVLEARVLTPISYENHENSN